MTVAEPSAKYYVFVVNLVAG